MIKQLSIFDLELTSTSINENVKSIQPVSEGTSAFQFKIGMNVIFSVCKDAAVYEIIEVDKELITVSRTDKGYRCRFNEKEMTISSNEIKAIIEGDDMIQLPSIRTATLNLNFYRNRTLHLLTEITQSKKKQLDVLTYLLIVSPSSVINNKMVYLWDNLMARKIEEAENIISYVSPYIQVHDLYQISFFMRQKTINVEFISSESGIVDFDVSDISVHFYKMLETIDTTPIEQLSPFELMLLYRKNGYLLTYKAGTDEWYFQHPDSTKTMSVENKDDLYNVQGLITCYEEKFTKHTFLSDYIVDELDLFDTNDNKSDDDMLLDGFTVPSGTIVQLGINRRKYVVIEDDGTNVQLRNEIDPAEVINVTSTEMTFCYPYENKHLSVILPRFNRPKDLTIQTLMKRDLKYYHDLSEKEFLDAAVYKAACHNKGSVIPKIFRALIEGDEEYAKKCIKKSEGGSHSYKERFDSKGNIKELEFGLRNDSRKIQLNTNQIVKHLLTMLQRTKELAFNALSIPELQLAYYMRGYKLMYNTVTDEFILFKGIYYCKIKGHRAVLNDFDKAVESFERGKQ